MYLVFQAIASFIAVATLGMMLCVPRRFLFHSGLTGALGWTVYMALEQYFSGEMLNMFLAAFLVALVSQIFARTCKAPVTIFLITGILPLVPGVGVYRIVYYMILESNRTASYYFVYTLQIAGMIAVAILLVDTIFKIIGGKKKL